MVRKSDGGYGYGTTDMAAITHRIRTERADWVIYVADEGQAGHFKLVRRVVTHLIHVIQRLIRFAVLRQRVGSPFIRAQCQ